MSYPHDAVYEATYDSVDRARTMERSLRQEVGEIDDDRSQTALSRDGTRLELHVQAADLVALRAASNTWLSLLSVAEDVAAVGDAAR